MKPVDARIASYVGPLLFAVAAALGACASWDRAPEDTTPSVQPAPVIASAQPSLMTNVQPGALPAYDSDRGITRASSQTEYEAAIADTRYTFEQFSYVSDGLTVGAFLYRPREPRGRMPVVVFNRGGFVRQDFGAEMLVQAQRFNEAGFIFVAPWLRGSNGTEGRDEMGGADLNDLMNIAPVIRSLPYADANRVFLYGVSRGSMMTFQALRDGFPARAAVVYGSWGDLDFLIGPNGSQREIAAQIWPELEEHRAEIIERRSALRWSDRLSVPILQLHGADDGGIPVAESRRIAEALASAGTTHDFRVFEGAGHSMEEVAAERDAAAIAWFRQHDTH